MAIFMIEIRIDYVEERFFRSKIKKLSISEVPNTEFNSDYSLVIRKIKQALKVCLIFQLLDNKK